MNDKLAKDLSKEFNLFIWFIAGVFILLVALAAGGIYGISAVLNESFTSWLPTLTLSLLLLIICIAAVFFFAGGLSSRVRSRVTKAMDRELRELRSSAKRGEALQTMASTLRATLSFERVVESCLDVCNLAVEEMGIPGRSLVGAVYLYEHSKLVPVATRSFIPNDQDQRIEGKYGIIGESLTEAEPVITLKPQEDPELQNLITFRNCHTVVCIPLRAGFHIFGAMILGTEKAINFGNDHLELFNSVADHAVIALQNAKLYQDLKAEKQRMIDVDEEARKELARDLHDGPTQSVAAIAMRANYVRTVVLRNPDEAIRELDKMEELARDTSQELRDMLFTLRPLVLETEGLGPAIKTIIERIQQTDKLPIQFVGQEIGELLNSHAQSIVFSIVEEAVNNARKYSGATHVEIRFWKEDDLFVAQVEDNGVGFDVQSVSSGYSSRGSLGMINMRERAERIDGSLRIDSDQGSGTTVTLVVPLEKYRNMQGKDWGTNRHGFKMRN